MPPPSPYPCECATIRKDQADFSANDRYRIDIRSNLSLDGSEEVEVTTFRTEDVYMDYHRPSAISFVR